MDHYPIRTEQSQCRSPIVLITFANYYDMIQSEFRKAVAKVKRGFWREIRHIFICSDFFQAVGALKWTCLKIEPTELCKK